MTFRDLLSSVFRLLLLIITITILVIAWAFAYVLHGRSGNAKLPVDCAIVFGAAIQPIRDFDGRVIGEGAGPAIERRVETAANLWKAGSVKHLFFSGGRGEGLDRSEADVMAEEALHHNVPQSAFTLEDQSKQSVTTTTWHASSSWRRTTIGSYPRCLQNAMSLACLLLQASCGKPLV